MCNNKWLILILFLFLSQTIWSVPIDTIHLTLQDAILMACRQSVDAAVALNELKTAYWEYRTHLADQLPEMNFNGTVPAFNKQYSKYQQADGSYTFVENNALSMNGTVSIDQNISLTGGKISLVSSMDFNRQLGHGAFSEFMTIPIGITLTQPIFGINTQKWLRRIEPIRYQEAKASYIEQVETLTMMTISNYFNLLLALETLRSFRQNLENAEKLYEVAQAKRKIGQISENELMQLQLSALQMKGLVTEAESNCKSYMFKLRSFLGLEDYQIIEPMVPESIPLFRIYYDQVIEKAHINNSFSKNIRRRQLEAEYAVASAKGNRRNINLYVSVGFTGKDHQLKPAYQQLRANQVVEVGFTIPLLDWGKRRGQLKVAESNRDVVMSQIRKEELDFDQNIFLLVEYFNNQAGQLEIATEADRIALKRYETSIKTFMIGKINILDLNDARQSKDNARQKHIQELFYYWYYYYNIRSITLFDFMNNTTLDADFETLVRN